MSEANRRGRRATFFTSSIATVSTLTPGPSGRLAPRSSRQPAARHFDVPPARLEPLTRHASYGAAELARMEYQAENDSAGIREEIRTMAVPGHPTDWMLVAIAPANVHRHTAALAA